MARIRVYIAPFKDDGSYNDFVEVTDDVDGRGIGAIALALDVNDYDVGVFTNSQFGISLRNDHGRFSDANYAQTIFKRKRSNSKIRITYDMADVDFEPLVSFPGDLLGGEVTVFEGLLNDDSTTMNVADQIVQFNVLGYESLFDQTVGPDWVGTPPADNKISTLAKALIPYVDGQLTTSTLTFDASRILPGNDVSIDDLSTLSNKTAKEILDVLLTASNSVLYMDGTTPVVSARTPSVAVNYNFYGPGSELGPENVFDIQEIRSGMNRTFNYVTWRDTTFVSQDGNSIAAYGVRKKEVAIDGVTNSTTQQSILNSLKLEFGNPKQEFKLVTKVDYDTLALALLGRVSIDYPLVPISTEALAYYGSAQYGTAQYSVNTSGFQILPADHYKVIGKEIDLAGNQITFFLRGV